MSFSLQRVSVRHHASDSLALHEIELSLAPGEQLALIGPSGAGKTTLLHTLALAHRPAAGRIDAFGCDPWAIGEGARHRLRARLFLAPQTPPLPPRQRVVTAVLAGRLPRWSLPRALASLLRPADPAAARDALARFNLQDKLWSRVDRLSGGERQRCSLARLLVSDAQALLVDEPLSALDPALAVQTLEVLQQEAAARGALLICSLHQVPLARERFGRIVGLRDGRIVFDARAADVSDDMIAALYRDARNDSPAPDAPPLPAAPVSRCF
ncbi:phosphonate ABC transporter ATP-binding protein [Noviherbaspirillum aridicola]|uniref:Phosphonates import ATP-binding protein PhnC 1 n=1 Tax=Noviherbaspirillum aridicola TaxID=2849687 RepID=A0ABQ4Q597_9BURK|nr:ATP-binding cassette domain-containing protein [Noviherbaspirillum aridicola]GIZ52288.1 phosphonates import ATP-binding protein PhnC 1 [Noviherbaspirillum aridicola]